MDAAARRWDCGVKGVANAGMGGAERDDDGRGLGEAEGGEGSGIVPDEEEEGGWAGAARSFFGRPMHPAVQAAVGGAMYAFHILVLCKRTLTVGGASVSWEVGLGTVLLFAYLALSKDKTREQAWAILKGSVAAGEELPTKVNKMDKRGVVDMLLLLGLAYLGSGYAGQFINLCLCMMAALGAPLTLGMCTSLQVLLAHLGWVVAGSLILHVRTGSFFRLWSDEAAGRADLGEEDRWFRAGGSGNLVWTVMGGYWLTSYISSFALSVNGVIHQLPGLKQVVSVLNNLPDSQTELIVDQLKNPNGGLFASIIGCIGPCVTGPVWEELLYRGFLLQAMSLFVSVPTAVDLTSLIFALNHMNARAFAHLYILGWLWSIIYIRTKNMLVPILIHMLWNCRTFISPV